MIALKYKTLPHKRTGCLLENKIPHICLQASVDFRGFHSRRNRSYLFQTVVLNNCGSTTRGVRGVERPEIL